MGGGGGGGGGGKAGQNIKGDKRFKSENLASFDIQTSTNFFEDQLSESKNISHICLQTYKL